MCWSDTIDHTKNKTTGPWQLKEDLDSRHGFASPNRQAGGGGGGGGGGPGGRVLRAYLPIFSPESVRLQAWRRCPLISP